MGDPILSHSNFITERLKLRPEKGCRGTPQATAEAPEPEPAGRETGEGRRNSKATYPDVFGAKVFLRTETGVGVRQAVSMGRRALSSAFLRLPRQAAGSPVGLLGA